MVKCHNADPVLGKVACVKPRTGHASVKRQGPANGPSVFNNRSRGSSYLRVPHAGFGDRPLTRVEFPYTAHADKFKKKRNPVEACLASRRHVVAETPGYPRGIPGFATPYVSRYLSASR